MLPQYFEKCGNIFNTIFIPLPVNKDLDPTVVRGSQIDQKRAETANIEPTFAPSSRGNLVDYGTPFSQQY